MALVIEDGTGVAGANSYASVAEAKAYVLARGLTAFTGADSVIEGRLLQAMDFLEALRARYKGSKTDSGNALQWPRADVTIDGAEVGDDFMPTELKNAQIQLAYDSQTNDLQPTGSGQETKREKVGPIESEYFQLGTSTVRPQFNKAMDFLQPLLRGGGLSLSTLRV